MKNIDVNSSTNQRIKEKFVNQHVKANVNLLVEFILSNPEAENIPFTYEDFSNLSTYPEYSGNFASFAGGTDEMRSNEIESLRDLIVQLENDEDKDNSQKIEEIENEISELENLESEYTDIMEYWIVSRYLADKLNEKGHPVVSDGSNMIWGRTTSGQTIYMDGVINEICFDIQILDGQENSLA